MAALSSATQVVVMGLLLVGWWARDAWIRKARGTVEGWRRRKGVRRQWNRCVLVLGRYVLVPRGWANARALKGCVSVSVELRDERLRYLPYGGGRLRVVRLQGEGVLPPELTVIVFVVVVVVVIVIVMMIAVVILIVAGLRRTVQARRSTESQTDCICPRRPKESQ